MTAAELREALAAKGGGWRELAPALRQLPNLPELLRELESLADNDPETDVRYKARKILGSLSDRRKMSDVSTTAIPVVPPLGGLARLLAGRDPDARVRVIERFVKAHRAAAVDELVALLTAESDPTVLSTVVRLVGTTAPPSHLSVLRPFLGHANPRVVANAVEAMGRLDAGAALPMVLPVLVAEDHRVRANVLLVLYKEWKPEVLAYLSRMISSEKEAYRAAAVWCLGQLEDGEADEAMASMLAHEESPDLVDDLLKTFSEKRGRAAIPALSRFVADHPERAEPARAAMRAIAARENVGNEELAELVARAHHEQPAQGGLVSGIRRISRSVRALMLSRKARTASRIPVLGSRLQPVDTTARLKVGAALGVGLVLAVLVLALRPGPEAAATPGGRPAARPGVVLSQGPVSLSRFVGTVKSREGAMVLVEKDRTVYAVRFGSPAAVEAFEPGAQVFVTAWYRGWDAGLRRADMQGETIAAAR